MTIMHCTLDIHEAVVVPVNKGTTEHNAAKKVSTVELADKKNLKTGIACHTE